MFRPLPIVSTAVLAAVLWLSGDAGHAQAPERASNVTTVAILVTSPQEDVAALDARVEAMLATGRLVRTYAAADPAAPGRLNEYFAQFHQGVRVHGGGISRQRRNGITVSAFGTLYENIDVAGQPGLAVDVAMLGSRETATVAQATGSDVTTTVLPQLDGTYRLVYRATFQDGQVRFVDAHTGALVRTEDAFVRQSFGTDVGTGTGAHGDRRKLSVSHAGVYQAIDRLRPAMIHTRSTQDASTPYEALFQGAGLTATDDDNEWTNAAVVDAHANAGLVYDYLHQAMNWLGLNGSNAPIDLVVTNRATLENNAFFAPPGSSTGQTGLVAFGVSNADYPMATLDIVGHELMHGVTYFSLRQRTGSWLQSQSLDDGLGPDVAHLGGDSFPCNLTYLVGTDGSELPFLCSGGRFVLASNQGGAIDEGFADIFGTAVEFRFQPPGTGALRAEYANGEDTVPGGSASPQIASTYRSLSEPSSVPIGYDGVLRAPEHVDQRVRYTVVRDGEFAVLVPFSIVNGELVRIQVDNGGVHFNASILGHVYYRAVEGGTHRVSGRTVAGVGHANRQHVERVFFRAMTALMPNVASFQVAAAMLRQAAVDLYGGASAVYRAIDESLLASGL